MPLIKADRVKETSTSTGTGNFTLAGAATGFRAFSSVCLAGDTVFYVIDSDSGSEWETGLGTYSATDTLTRTTVHASSNSGSAVNFSAGTKNVYISLTGRQINTVSAAPPASTGAPARLVDLTAAAHTALTASTEYNDVYWNLARTVQFATGAITTQRAIRFSAPTYSFVAASTITNAATVEIEGPPISGTNATITNRICLRVLPNSGSKGIVIRGQSIYQSGNAFEIQNNFGTILTYMDSAFGAARIGSGPVHDSGSQLSVCNTNGAGTLISAVAYSSSDDAYNVYNYSGTKVFSILGNGSIKPATLADSAAANNTIYYSSTQSKLVYKDSAGTVNNLY
jgi:hypothetical protein